MSATPTAAPTGTAAAPSGPPAGRRSRPARRFFLVAIVVAFLGVAFGIGLGLGHARGPSPAAASPTGPGSPTGPAAPPAAAARAGAGTTTTTTTTQPPPLTGTALNAPAILSQSTWVDRGDPVMVATGDRTWFYWTQPLPALNVPFQAQTAGGSWGPMEDAMPTLPPWAATGNTWAPEVHRFGNRWVLYFAAALATDPPIHCIGAAVAATPTGPFAAQPQPFVCQRTDGGSIDPRVFVDPDGTPYLLWKSDENSTPGAGPTRLWSQPLSATGLQLPGQPANIYTADLPWQDGLAEAPDLVYGGGQYWLFYSAGQGYFSADYAIGDAQCSGPAGPCVDRSTQPFLASNAQGQGPGEESVFVAPTGDWLVYNPTGATVNKIPRPTAIARLGFGPLGPYLAQS